MSTKNPASPESSDRSGVLIVGLGRFGEALARGLVEQGIEVLAVDFDEDIVQRVSGDIPNVVQADATSARALRQIGAEQFSRAVVAIATNIEASVLATLALIDELKIPTVWAKALTMEHAKILERVGVQRVIQPEHDMGQRTARSITRRVADYFHVEDNFALVEMSAPQRFLGRPLGDTGIRAKYGVTIVSIKPPGGRVPARRPGHRAPGGGTDPARGKAHGSGSIRRRRLSTARKLTLCFSCHTSVNITDVVR